ncbi:MAG: hypothetical protein JSR58_01170 [Verrucomicrobia bacterium]|nr:hypothetical protein [Verrucomicrobiota bacterium]
MNYLKTILPLPRFEREAEAKRQQELFQQLTQQSTKAQGQLEQWELFRKTVVEQLNNISNKEFDLRQTLGQFKIDLENCKTEELPQKLEEIKRIVIILMKAREWLKQGKEIKVLQDELRESGKVNDKIAEELGQLQAKVQQKKKANERAQQLNDKVEQQAADLQQILQTPRKLPTTSSSNEQSEY